MPRGSRGKSSGSKRRGYIVAGRRNVYDALRRQGKTKAFSAAVANGGRTKVQRSLMARRSARTRKARGRQR